MITVFCDFFPMAFFLNTNVMIDFFKKNWLCFESKTPIFFAKFFREIFLKITTSIPDPEPANLSYVCKLAHWPPITSDGFKRMRIQVSYGATNDEEINKKCLAVW
jgi:hypothetical protein